MRDAQRVLIRVSLAVGLGDTVRLERMLHDASNVAGQAEIEEALMQSYLFAGYPAALNALAVWRRISGLPAAVAQPMDLELWTERGAATCGRVYAGQYERLRRNIAALHPDMEQWMVVEGYGKVLGRPGLDLVTRELCVVALLSVQSAAPQLYSHLRGALNAGADEALVTAAVDLIGGEISEARADVLTEQWSAVRERRAAGTGD